MQRTKINFKRKRSDSNNCHQCHNKDKENVPEEGCHQLVQAPFEHGNVRQNPAQPGEKPSISQMRRELERMKLALETKGNLFQPHMKDYLLKEILLLTDKINSSAGGSSSS